MRSLLVLAKKRESRFLRDDSQGTETKAMAQSADENPACKNKTQALEGEGG